MDVNKLAAYHIKNKTSLRFPQLSTTSKIHRHHQNQAINNIKNKTTRYVFPQLSTTCKINRCHQNLAINNITTGGCWQKKQPMLFFSHNHSSLHTCSKYSIILIIHCPLSELLKEADKVQNSVFVLRHAMRTSMHQHCGAQVHARQALRLRCRYKGIFDRPHVKAWEILLPVLFLQWITWDLPNARRRLRGGERGWGGGGEAVVRDAWNERTLTRDGCKPVSGLALCKRNV